MDLTVHTEREINIDRFRKICNNLNMPHYNRFSIAAEELREMYVSQGMTPEQIAEHTGYKRDTIMEYLGKYGITSFTRGNQQRFQIGEDQLRKLYLEEKKTIPEMAVILGCSQTPVWNALKKYGLQLSAEEQGARRSKRNAEKYKHQRMTGGYRYVKKTEHPLANANGYVSEHRVSAEAGMKRNVNKDERIHHINFDKHDNGVENLAVLPNQSAHRKIHEYLGQIGVYLIGLSEIRPEPVDFGQPVFWGGKYVTSVDLLGDRTPCNIGPTVSWEPFKQWTEPLPSAEFIN
jgi:hypothetical protein